MTTLTCSYDRETLREVYADNDLLSAEIERLENKVRFHAVAKSQLNDLGELVGLLHGAGRDYDALCFASWAVEIARKGTEAQRFTRALRICDQRGWSTEAALTGLAATRRKLKSA